MKDKTIALLDIDKTLIIANSNNSADIYNDDLLKFLKNNGVNDIYLFTMMNLNKLKTEFAEQKTTISRKKLVEYLKKKGFNVHGVITPADCELKNGLGIAYKSYYLPQYKRFENNTITISTCDNDEDFKKAAEGANKLFDKGKMFDYFLQENKDKSLGITSCIFFDDSDENIILVNNANTNNKNKIALSSIKVTDPKITKEKQDYDKAIFKHFFDVFNSELDQLLTDRGALKNFLEEFNKEQAQRKVLELKNKKWKNLNDIKNDKEVKETIFIHGNKQQNTEDYSYNSGVIIVNNDKKKPETFFSDPHGDKIIRDKILPYSLQHLIQGEVVINGGDSFKNCTVGHEISKEYQPLEAILILLLLQKKYPQSFICLAGNHDRDECLEGMGKTKKNLATAVGDAYINSYIFPKLLARQIQEINKDENIDKKNKDAVRENLDKCLKSIDDKITNDVIENAFKKHSFVDKTKKEFSIYKKKIKDESEIKNLCKKTINDIKNTQLDNDQKDYLSSQLEQQILLRRAFIKQRKIFYKPAKKKSEKKNSQMLSQYKDIIVPLFEEMKKDQTDIYTAINSWLEIAISLQTDTFYAHASLPNINNKTKLAQILDSSVVASPLDGKPITLYSAGYLPGCQKQLWLHFEKMGFKRGLFGHIHTTGGCLKIEENYSLKSKNAPHVFTTYTCPVEEKDFQEQKKMEIEEKKNLNKEEEIEKKKVNSGIFNLNNLTKNVLFFENTGISTNNILSQNHQPFPYIETKTPYMISNDPTDGVDFIPVNGDKNKQTLVYWCEQGNLEKMKELVSMWDPSDRAQYINKIANKGEQAGNNALHIACKKGHTEIVRFLLDEGADPNLLSKFAGYSSLHFAVMAGNNSSAVIKLLLEKNANPNVRDDVAKVTPLHLCVGVLNLDGCDALLKSEKIDVNIRDKNKKTALELLNDIGGGDKEAIQKLKKSLEEKQRQQEEKLENLKKEKQLKLQEEKLKLQEKQKINSQEQSLFMKTFI